MRSFGRGIKHLLLAAVWLVALFCVAEVALRARLWYQRSHAADDAGEVTATPDILPSAETYQQLRPLMRVAAPEAGAEAVRTNSFGLRGPEIAVPKPAGVFRVLCLGDDTTLALHLREDETYCQRLREHLQQQTQLTVEVVNAGLPGGCPLTSLLLLRHRLLGLQPDLILQHVDPTDVEDDRKVRPFTFMDDAGVPLAAVHPLCRKATAPTLISLTHEFVLLDWVRERLVAEWQAGTGGSAEAWDPVQWDMAAEQALAPLQALQTLAGGAYCELIVTAAGDPLRPGARPIAAQPRMIEMAGARTEPARRPDLAAYARAHRLLYLDACESAGAPELGGVCSRVATTAEHDTYAALQAAFIVQNVPGVWRGADERPGTLPPLPDTARVPRE